MVNEAPRLAQYFGFLKFSNLLTGFFLLVIGKLVVCSFRNRIFNFSLILCLLWNGVGVVRVLCSSRYRLCSVVKCVVSSALGNSSL